MLRLSGDGVGVGDAGFTQARHDDVPHAAGAQPTLYELSAHCVIGHVLQYTAAATLILVRHLDLFPRVGDGGGKGGGEGR
jgi:hypothetical protein